ncbi:uncharacterized protein [Macrobrachium rosenbergii]|uniref:uncharacterized protein n=1 Tax=Macrobrachium rosenbergii TaxID=79674 RepID=UPI0034D6202A
MSLRSSSSSLDIVSDYFRGEDKEDRRNPPCTVSLYMRPTQGKKGISIKIAKHWALHFDWGYYNATHDAIEVGGKLTPSFHEGKPVAPEGLEFTVEKIKENLRVMPQDVEAAAKKNRFSGASYNVVSANCQNWATEMGNLLGFKLQMGQVLDAVDKTLTAVGIGASALVIANLAQNKRNVSKQQE